MIYLLGVLNPYVAGGYAARIPINWGNPFNIPDFNPYHGRYGGAPIDQANRPTSQWPDYRGFRFETLTEELKNGVGPDFIRYLNRVAPGLVGGETPKPPQTAPNPFQIKPTPY